MDLIRQNIEYYNTLDWLRDMYCGLHILKFKTDLKFYEEQLELRKPDIIIETGTLQGGSALWFQDRIKGQVITIDIASEVKTKDPRILYIDNSSVNQIIIDYIKGIIKGKSVMVVLDSAHTKAHVLKEIALYAPLVTPKQLLVVEDTMYKYYFDNKPPLDAEEFSKGSPGDAVEQWDKRGFKEIEAPDITMNPHGWFVKI